MTAIDKIIPHFSAKYNQSWVSPQVVNVRFFMEQAKIYFNLTQCYVGCHVKIAFLVIFD